MTPEERAARLWCSPEKASTTLDVEFCKAIANQIREAERAAFAKAKEMAAKTVQEHIWVDRGVPMPIENAYRQVWADEIYALRWPEDGEGK